MKKLSLLLITGLFLIAGLAKATPTDPAEPSGYKITITIDGMTDELAYLGYHLADKKYVEDTAEVVNGKVTFAGERNLTPGIYFLYTPSNIFMELVVSDQHFSIEAQKSDLLNTKKIKDSKDNELFNTFQTGMADFQQRSAALREQLKTAANADDSAGIQLKLKELNQSNVDFQQKLIRENPKSFTAQVLRIMARPTTVIAPEGMSDAEAKSFKFYEYRRKFWEGVDFTNEGILRTPVFEPKLLEYMDNLVYQHPDSINQAIDDLLDKTRGTDATFRYILVTMTNKYQSSQIMGMDAVFVHLAEQYYLTGKADWADDEMLSKFREAVADIKPNLIGSVAPPLRLVDTTTTNPVTLESVAKEYTILFFYDPDCSHCKKETPKMLDIYHRLKKDLSVECMGVCIGKDVEAWREFVKTFDCDWVNAADPFLRSNFRREYNIRSTPTVYVLDKNLKILGKRLGVEQIESFIKDHKKLVQQAGQ